MSHASKRSLYNMPPATYYVPQNLLEPLKKMADLTSQMNEQKIGLTLKPVNIGDDVHVSKCNTCIR